MSYCLIPKGTPDAKGLEREIRGFVDNCKNFLVRAGINAKADDIIVGGIGHKPADLGHTFGIEFTGYSAGESDTDDYTSYSHTISFSEQKTADNGCRIVYSADLGQLNTLLCFRKGQATLDKLVKLLSTKDESKPFSVEIMGVNQTVSVSFGCILSESPSKDYEKFDTAVGIIGKVHSLVEKYRKQI